MIRCAFCKTTLTRQIGWRRYCTVRCRNAAAQRRRTARGYRWTPTDLPADRLAVADAILRELGKPYEPSESVYWIEHEVRL